MLNLLENNFNESLITQAKKNSWDHVFFVSNQTSLIISKLIIDNFKISLDNVRIISFRDIDTSLIKIEPFKVKVNIFDSYLDKLLWTSLAGKRILRELSNSKSFILYVEWASREAEKVLNSKNCRGHNYIEMGQHTYMQIPLFDPKKLSFVERFKKNWKNTLSNIDEYAHYYYRNDVNSLIGINEEIFPLISNQKKIILSNLNELKDIYSPKLNGIKVIGLTCASRRLKRDEWGNMIKKLISKLPDNAIVKLHPSFTTNLKIFTEFRDLFYSITKNKFSLCDNDVILELEMLHEEKLIIGPQTSLSRYANQLGSKFQKIELY
mgnify:CR=1 FL=1